MNKIIVLFLLGIMVSMADAAEVDKIKEYINSLEKKIKVAQTKRNSKKVKQLSQLLVDAKATLAKEEAGVQKPLVVAEEEQPDQLGDLKDEMNGAIAELKNKVDKVEADNKDVKVGSTVFFRWQKYTANGGTTTNNFDIDRAYLDFKKKLDWNASARVTLDVARLDTSKLDTSKKSQNLFDYLKYAYVEMPVNIPSEIQFVPFSLTAKVGLQHTVWIDWDDKILDMRFIAKSIVDNEGIMTSADFGLAGLGKISINGLPELEYHATVLNGTGYKAVETDSKKAVAMRVNSTVYQDETWGGVMLGAFGNISGVDASLNSNGSTKQAGMAAALKGGLVTTELEYIYGTGIAAYSAGVVYPIPLINGLSLFGRMDNYDPNRGKANDQIDRSFYGLTYQCGKDVRIALDMQNTTGGSAASTSAGKTTSAIYLHGSVTM